MHNYTKRLKRLRWAHGFSINQISDYLGLDYYRLESGEEKMYLGAIRKLANLYNCSVEYILGRSDDYDFSKIPKDIHLFDLRAYAQMNQVMAYLKLLRKVESRNGK